MRSFPSALLIRRGRERLPAWAHPQWLVTALAVLVALAGLAMPLANANDRDDLEDKQDQVRGQISDVRGEINEASRAAAKLARKLEKAKGALDAAQARLAGVRSDLADARAAAAVLADKLVKAQAALEVARQELEQARIEVADQRDESRDTIIRIATGGDPRLALMASYADGHTMEEVLLSQTATGVVTSRQEQSLERLVEAEALLEERREQVRAARDEVASAKAAADQNVKRIAGLVEEAEAGEAQVRALVSDTSTARAAVIRARAADRAALARLQKREARIKARIVALSRRQSGSYNGSTDGFLARPGPGPVTSPYGYRIHPIYGYYGLHNGIDFGTGCGAQLWAGESGTVIDTYYDEVYGNRLYLAIGRVNGATMTLVYNHLSGYAVGEGAKVRRGQVVGYSGATGWSTGCHLHFTVLRNGNPVDPAPYL